MPNTFTQIYLHVVFAVAQRACVIQAKRKEELQKYMTGIVTRQGQKMIALNCMPDHVHILLGLKPNVMPSDLIGDIKTGSTNYINKQQWIDCRFSWQEGFGAFSVSHSHVAAVINCIRNQETHHRRKSFRDEYMEFLRRHDVPYDERYYRTRCLNGGEAPLGATCQLCTLFDGRWRFQTIRCHGHGFAL